MSDLQCASRATRTARNIEFAIHQVVRDGAWYSVWAPLISRWDQEVAIGTRNRIWSELRQKTHVNVETNIRDYLPGYSRE